jgi:hypothetical protein
MKHLKFIYTLIVFSFTLSTQISGQTTKSCCADCELTPFGKISPSECTQNRIRLSKPNCQIQGLSTVGFTQSETLIIAFCHSWLDLTDQVSVSGRGVQFVRILEKGVRDRFTPDERTYCKVEFRVLPGAEPGTRTITLSRPGTAGIGRDQTTYTLNLISRMSLTSTTKNTFIIDGTEKTFKLIGKNLNNSITSVKATPSGIFRTLRIISKTTNASGDDEVLFGATFSSPGEITYSSFINTMLNTTTTNVFDYSFTPAEALSTSRVFIEAENPPRPDLVVTFNSQFVSPNIPDLFSTKDLQKFPNICGPNSISPTSIPPLVVVVRNIGTATSAPTTITVSRNTNENLPNATSTINVVSLSPGDFREFNITRTESRICVRKDSRNRCFRCDNGTDGINLWNDVGIIARVAPVAGEVNTSNNSATVTP